MSSIAHRDLYEDTFDFDAQPTLAPTGTEGAAALRKIAAERLAAHRSKRAPIDSRRAATEVANPVISETAQRVRDAVVARYRQSPSYSELLSASSAQISMISPWIEEPVKVAEPVVVSAPLPMYEPDSAGEASDSWDWVEGNSRAANEKVAHQALAPGLQMHELQVRPYEELPQPMQPPARTRADEHASQVHAEELAGLEEEIAFRLDPEFVEHHIEPLPIQANIIEFPRQLVAPRKARPRLAEGPLRTGTDVQPGIAEEPPQPAQPEFQMRIFEVEETRAAVETRPEASQGVAVETEWQEPEWQRLKLSAPVKEYVAPLHADQSGEPGVTVAANVQERLNLPVASLQLRLMASTVDAVCIGISFVGFASVAAWMGGTVLQDLTMKMLAISSAIALVLLTISYQAVFFMLGGTTPGMSYAGLVFRTLSGKPPTRQAMRKRVGANVLAVAPLGLGLMWSVFDRQRLGWNDRISGTFLREF